MSRAAVVLVLGTLAAGCLQPDAFSCGDGRTCPADTTCDVANHLCAATSQRAACDGLVDGNTCAFSDQFGACNAGTCVAATWLATALIGGTHSPQGLPLFTYDPYGGGLFNRIAADRRGNLYITDDTNSQIRRIDPAGLMTTIAGSGLSGHSGDDGPATSAALALPRAIVVDGLGDVYVAEDTDIRRIDANGVITTVAGGHSAGPRGDGGLAIDANITAGPLVRDGLGNIYFIDHVATVRRIDVTSKIITTVAGGGSTYPPYYPDTGDGGPATQAYMNTPFDLAVDGHDNVYILENDPAVIRRVDAVTGIITTIAGGAAGFSGDGGPAKYAGFAYPTALVIDAVGNLYVADTEDDRVRRIDAATQVITTVVGAGFGAPSGDGGSAASAELAAPVALALDDLGNLYIAESTINRIRRVDATQIITTVASGTSNTGDAGAAISAPLSTGALQADDTAIPATPGLGVAVDGLGDIYIADTGHNSIRRVDPAGVITTVAGTGSPGLAGDGGPAISAELNAPYGVTIDRLGNLYIADTNNHAIRRIDPNGVITTIAGTFFDNYSGDGGPATSAMLAYPEGVAVDDAGDLYIADTGNSCIRRIDPAGVITTVAGGIGGGNGCDHTGDGGPATSAAMCWPSTVIVDARHDLYIADPGNPALDKASVRRVDATTGIITAVAGIGATGFSGDGGPATSAQLSSPTGLALDGAGNLYIADSSNERIRRVDTSGIITTIAGTGVADDGGDAGPVAGAQLNYPTAIALDGAGNLYIADAGNQRIRRLRVDGSGVVTTLAGALGPIGMGPLPEAHLADPRALVVVPPLTLVAGGTTGTIQAATATGVAVVAGRYPESHVSGALARFRDASFGDVAGLAYDASAGVVYVSESSAGAPANRIDVVTMVDPADPTTWTMAPLANMAGTAGFADGAAATAQFREPTGLVLDGVARVLYVADTGNDAIRAIDLATADVSTVAGIGQLDSPQAVAVCNGDLFIADTRNNRVRRLATDGTVSTVLGDGSVSSSGQGSPASGFPVAAPSGVACDAVGNVYVTSTTAVRELAADAHGVVDGSGLALTIYGAAPRAMFPDNKTSCLSGLTVVDATDLEVVDSCTGMLVQLRRTATATN